MSKTWGHYAKWNKPMTKNTVQFYLHEVFRVVKYIKQKIEWYLAGTRGRRKWGMFNECRVSVLKDENILEIGCTTMWKYLIPLNIIL